jgi:hypothetical protein
MKSLGRIAIRTALLATLTLAAGAAGAQTAEDGPPPHHHGPPPEALEACKSLSSGQECSFTMPRGTISGTCWAPEGKPLACRPKHAPGPGGSESGSSPPKP